MSLLQAGFGSSGDDYEITDSLRLRSSASAYLARTPSSTGDTTEWTWSAWVKHSDLATNFSLFSADHAGGSNAYLSLLINNSDEFQIFEYTGSAYTLRLATNAVLRDPSAWYHLVCAVDTDQGTDTNRIKLYVNGVQQTSLRLSTYPSSGHTTYVNVSGNLHAVGATVGATTSPERYLDGYLTEVNFIDGQQLDADDFGEYDANGTWKAKEYTGTYGTNGFYLPMKPTTQADGFNTVLYTGDSGTQSISGVGFSPDFVWIKPRNAVGAHILQDTVRGNTKFLESNSFGVEQTNSSTGLLSFDSDGFTVGSGNDWNNSGETFVAWAWDAGSDSAASNTDGSITSTVKANDSYGFSIVSYTGNGTSGATIGHGLSSAPKMIIVKNRTTAGTDWPVYHEDTGNTGATYFNTTAAFATDSTRWNNTSPTSTVFSVGNGQGVNHSSASLIAYCFSEVTGYSKIDSYTGTGSAGNSVTGLGFQPAWLMIKETTSTGNWAIIDTTRSPNYDAQGEYLYANLTDASGGASAPLTFDSDGFTINSGDSDTNSSGQTYIYMAIADTADARFNFDASGNKNNWTPNNINSNAESESTYDLMKDTPSLVDENAGNFATFNPLAKTSSASTSNANLTGTTNTSTTEMILSTVGVSSGKWYWEVTPTSITSGGCMIGIRSTAAGVLANNFVSSTDGFGYYTTGNKYSPGASASYGASYTTNDVIGVALDMDAGTLTFYKNNASQGTAFTSISGTYTPGISNGGETSGCTVQINFGQRPLAYTPPSGFLKLNTFNLPDSTIEDGSDYFAPVIYTGNGSNQDITTGHSSDFVWLKSRSSTTSHGLYDNVRGTNKSLNSNNTNAEADYGAYGVDAFLSTGFGVTDIASSGYGVNENAVSYVAWSWKANGSGSSNTNGDINSTVSANNTSGFSIVSYTGNGTSNSEQTIGHGLSTAPKVVIVKNRTSASTRWAFYSTDLSSDATYAVKNLLLNTTGAESAYSSQIRGIQASNTFSVRDVDANGNANVNKSGDNYIAYVFAEVEGYSSFGSYTGNGSTDGPFIYTGFRPAMIMVKRFDTTNNWLMHDNKRDPYNQVVNILFPNLANAEFAGTASNYGFDFLSNGFKAKGTTGGGNDSGGTYIYMALAENPFKNANAR